jgi:tellurite resistance protein
MGMMSAVTLPELPAASPEARARAVEQVISLRAGDSSGLNTARLGAFLECAYLVAAHDGVTSEELAALSAIVRGLSPEGMRLLGLQALFDELSRKLAEEGRASRISRLASELGDHVARDEALGFAVLIAIADGALARRETRVLIELAEAFGHSVEELKLLIRELGQALTLALGSGS